MACTSEAAENRERKLDELQAVGAIYPEELTGPAALLAFAQGGGEADDLGLLVDPSADILEFGLTLAVDNTETGATVAVLSLQITLPAGYPSSSAAEFRGSIKRSTDDARYRDLEELSLELSDLLLHLCLDAQGEEAVCEVANAALEWARERCSSLPTVGAAPSAAVDESVEIGAANDDDDELELDDEDMDAEMIEAIREVLRPVQDKELKRKLGQAAAMPENSKGQREALMAIWRKLTPGQREQIVADDDSDDDSSDEDEPQGHRGGGSGAAGKKEPKPPPGAGAMPRPAQRQCTKGHELTPGNTKPADYKKMQGNWAACDVCKEDYQYTWGGYHCGKCKDWDCCVACGSKEPGPKKGKGGKTKR